eukprot:CAMPEP_0180448102 /NCGR_PEP_ID=MMETSP1036_2-20121128/17047_1 /TAXON_ID=632150 /ORGANISM="Azadinium spinosum, Strain 3D9" /LENGTH=119 /DNA_ID=CAMNT_0022454495 /DNA_START=72 /DNA_END=432 /DNA_ORIENTATION=+
MASKGLMSILFLISLAASSWADETCQATGGCMDEGDELAAIQMANDPASAGKKKTAAAALQVDASCMNVGDKAVIGEMLSMRAAAQAKVLASKAIAATPRAAAAARVRVWATSVGNGGM